MSKLFQFHDELSENAQALGFAQWGATSLKQPISLQFYESWLAKGYHGEMDYLQRHLEIKRDPTKIHAKLMSCLSFLHPYFPAAQPSHASKDRKRIALYAQNEDYHLWLQSKLKDLCDFLQSKYPEEIFLPATDSSPVLERDLAYRSGLGWVGKNTCLIRPQMGSLFFLGEILTSLSFTEKAQLMHDFCGTCNRCIEVCPTGAIEEPRLLNAKKCISYLTIESQQVPEEKLRKQIGDWFFGCDLCQTVCPWNQKVFGNQLETVQQRSLAEDRQDLIRELEEILSLSGKQLQKKYFGSPLMRARPFGLRRNAIIVATNQKLTELVPKIRAWEEDEKLRELVQWSLTKISN